MLAITVSNRMQMDEDASRRPPARTLQEIDDILSKVCVEMQKE